MNIQDIIDRSQSILIYFSKFQDDICDATREKVPKRSEIVIQIMIVSGELNIALYDS